MAAILDFTKFTFTAEQIRAVNVLVFDEVINAPEIDMIHTVFPNIITDKEIGFIGEGSMVGVANQGCDPTPQAFSIATRKLTWTPTDWEVLIAECWKDLKATAGVYSLKTKISIADFSSSDYINIVVEVLVKAMKKFIIRLFWFNDVDAENVVDGGIITNALDIKYFNLLDGFWKQMLAQIIVTPAQHVNIVENEGGTYLLQEMVVANVTAMLKSMIYKAPLVLRGKTDGFIVCTQSIYDAYAQSLQGTSLSELYVNLVNGQRTLSIIGVPIIAMPIWDEMIRAYEDNGTTYNNPNRAVYVTKDILGIGVDDPSSFGTLDVRYDKETRKVKIEAMGVADAKLMNPANFVIAI